MPATVRIRLKDVLIEKNMSQQHLAYLTDLRPSTISCICKEQVNRLYLSTLASLCTALNVSIQELVVLEQAGTLRLVIW
jgi:putative transcriptional regulator